MNKTGIPAAAAVLLLFISCADRSGERFFLASDTPSVTLYSTSSHTPVATAFRGVPVQMVKDAKPVRTDSCTLREIRLDGHNYLARESSLAPSDSLTVLEKELYVLSPASIIADTATCRISGLAAKGSKVRITGFDRLEQDGNVHRYKVQTEDGTSGFIFSKYLVSGPEEAKAVYGDEEFRAAHEAIRNPFKGGAASGCDFTPYPKTVRGGGHMPDTCRGIYLNFAAVGRIDSYIRMAKGTRLNTFVIDIKEDTCPGYKSDAMRRHSPTSYARAGENRDSLYAYAVRRLHEEGMWAVARICTFKDSYLVRDNPSVAITEVSTGKPIYHNKAHWPSAYDRRVWQYNVELAREAVRLFGFDEINFDYVRFPDRMNSIDHLIDFHNRYDESKAQAIQRFVAYACDELHDAGAYVSVDVFGEAANPGYVTAYGQYWPALSNVADVICGMPYPDHFPNHYCGIDKPWNHPYETLHAWGVYARGRQAVTPSPAKVRTWIQTWKVMKHVDKDGIDYDASAMKTEVKALSDTGINDGFVAWLASSNIERYRARMDAYR